MKEGQRLSGDFFLRDVLEVAPQLIGKILVRQYDGSMILRRRIVDVEAYRGREDLACHASKGRTDRTEVMFRTGGLLYVYLIYGMYWMLNIVTGAKDDPQAVLIRGLADISGPGRITKQLQIDRSFYGEDLSRSGRLWLENHNGPVSIRTGPRIGIDYAGEYWKNRPWRFTTDLNILY